MDKIKKSSSPETPVQISTKLATMPPWLKGIQVCSNEGPHPFPRGDNYEIAKNTLMNFKNLLLQKASIYQT